MRGVRGVCVACGRRLGAGQAWVHKNARAALPGSPSRHLPGRTRAHATVHVLHHTPVVVVVRKEVSLSVRGAVHSGRQLTAGIQASRQPRWCWDTSWARSTPSHGLDVTHTPLWYTSYAPPRPTPMWRPDGDRLSPALQFSFWGASRFACCPSQAQCRSSPSLPFIFTCPCVENARVWWAPPPLHAHQLAVAMLHLAGCDPATSTGAGSHPAHCAFITIS